MTIAHPNAKHRIRIAPKYKVVILIIRIYPRMRVPLNKSTLCRDVTVSNLAMVSNVAM